MIINYSMEKLPFVSVIVPNYNYAQYLPERMESIFNQTYQNYEVIILDDHSTDNSLEIIEKYQSYPRVSKILINDINSGSPFIQWEQGIKEASGDVIWIAESDDTCSRCFLETLVSLYVLTESVLTFCHSELIDERGEKLRDNQQMKNVTSDLSMDGKEFIRNYLAYSNEIQNASCAIFSKEAALGIDKEYMNYKGAGDWLFWINIAEQGNVSYSSSICNNYRLHCNTTSKVIKSGLEFYEMKSIYDRLLKNGYLNRLQFERCKQDNLYLILSLNEIPFRVKMELFRMWNVSLIHFFLLRMKMRICRILFPIRRAFVLK